MENDNNCLQFWQSKWQPILLRYLKMLDMKAC